jgi:hypothetical protein
MRISGRRALVGSKLPLCRQASAWRESACRRCFGTWLIPGQWWPPFRNLAHSRTVVATVSMVPPWTEYRHNVQILRPQLTSQTLNFRKKSRVIEETNRASSYSASFGTIFDLTLGCPASDFHRCPLVSVRFVRSLKRPRAASRQGQRVRELRCGTAGHGSMTTEYLRNRHHLTSRARGKVVAESRPIGWPPQL